MPRFIPLSINRQPKAKTITGTSLRTFWVRINEKRDFKRVILISMGNVPAPKTYISSAALRGVAAARDAESAIYTSPQGNKPFRTPAKPIVLKPGLPINLLN